MADYSDPSYVKQMVPASSLCLLFKKLFLYFSGAELNFPFPSGQCTAHVS